MPSDSSGPDLGTEPTPVDETVKTESNGNRREEPDGSPPVTDDRVSDLERRVADLEAELDAVRGLLDGVDAVDEAVERRASTALAKAEALEARIGTQESGLVRERLPGAREGGSDAAGGSAPTAGESVPDAEEYASATDTPSARATTTQRSDGFRDTGVGRHLDGSSEADDPRAPTGGNARFGGRADPDTAENGGAGAISSVDVGGRGVDDAGSDLGDSTRGSDGATDGDDDRSLASRLRDAFR